MHVISFFCEENELLFMGWVNKMMFEHRIIIFASITLKNNEHNHN